jgi:hypothetical protein
MTVRRHPTNLIRRLGSLRDAVMELIFLPNDTADAQAAPSPWPSIVAIIIATAAINAFAFLFISAPQIVASLEDTSARSRSAIFDMEMSTAFVKGETELMSRQQARVAELMKLYPSVVRGDPRDRTQIIRRSQINELEGASDQGRSASFETLGLDWSREWAKAQERAEISEIAMWQAIQDVAELSLRHGNPAIRRNAVQKLERQRLLLASSLAEVHAYARRLEPTNQSEMDQLEIENDALRGRIDWARRAMAISTAALKTLAWLFALLLWLWLSRRVLWLSRRLQRLIDKREERDKKLSG